MYTVYIRNNKTNELRVRLYPEEYDEWFWTEGNFGCDCNRALQFASTEEEKDLAWEQECGNSKYTVYKDGLILEED